MDEKRFLMQVLGKFVGQVLPMIEDLQDNLDSMECKISDVWMDCHNLKESKAALDHLCFSKASPDVICYELKHMREYLEKQSKDIDFLEKQITEIRTLAENYRSKVLWMPQRESLK